MAKQAWALPADERWRRASELPVGGCSESAQSLPLPALNQLLARGLARGSIFEMHGGRSCGKMALCLHVLAQATQRGEVCAVVDLHNSFHPHSAAASGVVLNRLLWVRCECNLEYAIRAVDLLLHAGGFGVVLLDFSEANLRQLNRIPISYWYRFRRAVENTPAVLLVCAAAPQAKSASGKALQCKGKTHSWRGKTPFARLSGLETIVAESKLTVIRPELLRITVI